MEKKFLRLKSLINPSIKTGDTVRLTDGSALSICDSNKSNYYVIVNSYPNITGYDLKLMEIDCIVVETGITDIICPGSLDSAYLCDIKVQVGDALFYTCSNLVEKIKTSWDKDEIMKIAKDYAKRCQAPIQDNTWFLLNL